MSCKESSKTKTRISWLASEKRKKETKNIEIEMEINPLMASTEDIARS